MNLANMNHLTLSTQLEKEVPEVFVIVAKHRVAGLGTEALADLIGCKAEEIDELESDTLYIEVRGIIGAMAASATADQGFIWDSIENIAGKRLLERIETERDPEFLLRAAATANRMTRRSSRNADAILEPALAGKKVGITLTRRMVERLTADGTKETATEERLSIHDGSMKNPNFDEVSGLLGLKPAKVFVPSDAQLLSDMGLDEIAA